MKDVMYRAGKKEDYPKIKAFLEKTEYFNVIDLDALGGSWLIGEKDGTIYATLWCFVDPPHAFIDYWAGSAVAAAKIGLIAEAQFKIIGVKYVRGTVARDNKAALRMATEGFGMLTGPNYQLVFKELKNGNTDNDARDDSTASGSAGAVNNGVTPATGATGPGTTG